MTRKYILASILFLFFAALADLSAQVSEKNEVNFAYDVAFDMNFDNRVKSSITLFVAFYVLLFPSKSKKKLAVAVKTAVLYITANAVDRLF